MWLQHGTDTSSFFLISSEKSLMPTQYLKSHLFWSLTWALSHFTRDHCHPTRAEPGHGTRWCYHKENAFSPFIRSESRVGSAVGTGEQRDGHQQLLGHSQGHKSHQGKSMALPQWQVHPGHQLGQPGLFSSRPSNKYLVSSNSLLTSASRVILKTLWVPFSA